MAAAPEQPRGIADAPVRRRAVAGIDVGADRAHVVVLDVPRHGTACKVLDAFVTDRTDTANAITRLEATGVGLVGIDGPDAASIAAHAHDDALAPKFRTARCGEIALGRERGIWVSWATPARAPFAAWMQHAFALHAAARASGLEPREVYPHAAFRVLAGGSRPPSKSTAAGVRARVALLRAAGIDAPVLDGWSHDALDATVAALVMADASAVGVSCGHDGSAIWLPSSPATLPA